jgi:hypothetical protein
MTKDQKIFILVIGLVILGVALFTYDPDDHSTWTAFPATIQRDCAPWDGAAFTVAISLEDGTAIDVSIWQSPDIQFPKTFSFPDDTGQVGNAGLIRPTGLPDPLTGTVSFTRVDPSRMVEGTFDLQDEKGNQYKGTFNAGWDDQIMLCG